MQPSEKMTRTNWTRAAQLWLVGLALATCGHDPPPEGNAPAVADVAEKASGQCALPTLAMADSAQLASTLLDETKGNFANAFQSACAKGLLKATPLIDPKASDQGHLFLVNAPEANVASIYLSEVDGSRMVLEYPFLTTDGKTQVPSPGELEEAIYCAVRGATAEEQESSGRCLVD
jgi:hypothetical protein